MNFGVYISTLNEEILIEAALKNLVKVFPQVEVVDLGSKDSTLEIVKRLNVPINEHVLSRLSSKHSLDGPAQEWIALKNDYADKHDWILSLDGDEIFDEENLLKIKAKVEVENHPHSAYHIGWRMVRETSTGKQISNMIPSGAKIYKCSDYYFRRGWPNEMLVTRPLVLANEDTRDDCDIWCWHGVLLKRSNSVIEHTPRRKKREERSIYFDKVLKWEDVDKWPWE